MVSDEPTREEQVRDLMESLRTVTEQRDELRAIASSRDDGLTDAEGMVSDHIVAAVNAFGRLPRQHPQELDEFVAYVHGIQGLLTTRIARRHYPEGWPTHVA